MPKDKHKVEIHCPECGSKAMTNITENDGFAYCKRGPERVITAISGSISIKGDNYSCDLCSLEWLHGEAVSIWK